MTKRELDPTRVAIVCPGDQEQRRTLTPEKSRFSAVFKELTTMGAQPELAVYNNDFCDEVRQQLMRADAVLVWLNPIEGGRDRSVLDAMLRDVAASGVFVSTHPDVILKLGTKEVLYQTRDIGWGCDTHVYRSLEQMRRELPPRLARGEARVLKQYRGHSGDGVWKVEAANHGDAVLDAALVRARHAKRGSVEETIRFRDFLERCTPYFGGEGRMIDQAYQKRLPEGMIRCYLVHGKVAGFGHQAVNALHPDVPQPGPRLYHPPDLEPFQKLKRQLEGQWLPAVQRLLAIDTYQLPVLWDCDFMLGPRNDAGEDTYVLCEINVSSVAPFPDSAVEPLARAAMARARAAQAKR
jgi:hypothetical protein